MCVRLTQFPVGKYLMKTTKCQLSLTKAQQQFSFKRTHYSLFYLNKPLTSFKLQNRHSDNRIIEHLIGTLKQPNMYISAEAFVFELNK